MLKFLKIVFVTVFSLILIVAIAGFVLISQVDFNQYKGTIIKMVDKSLGRKLTLGDIKVKASFTPMIEIRDVSLSNASWAKDEKMISAKSVDVGMALIPLISKNFVISAFRVNDAVINLEETSDGKNNWTFDVDKEALNSIKTTKNFEIIKSANASDDMGFLSSVTIKEVLLNDVKINYTDKMGKKQSYNINSLKLEENKDKNIDFVFDVNGGEYKGNGVVGAMGLLSSNSGYPIDAKLNVQGIDIATKLMLYNVLDDISFKGNVNVSGFMGKNSGYDEFINVDIDGDLKKIKADIKELNIAKNVIKGELACDLSGKTPDVKGKINSDKIDIALFKKKQKIAIVDLFVKDAVASDLVSNMPVPYEYLGMVNANIDVAIAKVVNKNELVGRDLLFNINTKNGEAQFKILEGVISDGVVKGDFKLGATDKKMSADASIEGIKLVELFKALELQTEVFNIIDNSGADFYLNVSGSGDTYASLINDLNGNMSLIVNKTQMHLGNIGILKGNVISQLLNTIKVTKGNDDLDMSCAVVRADFKNGEMIFPNGIVVNADKFTIVADGDINLKNDKLNISVKPFAGRITDTNIAKALSSLVRLTGTIREPKIGIDGANAIKTIVGVTTAGPVYLGAQMLLENDGSPCYTALEGTGYESKFPKPKNVVSTTSEDVGKILNDSMGSVKDTTKNLINLLSGNVNKK